MRDDTGKSKNKYPGVIVYIFSANYAPDECSVLYMKERKRIGKSETNWHASIKGPLVCCDEEAAAIRKTWCG